MLTQPELKNSLHYDSETGLFTQLLRTSKRIKINNIAGGKNKIGYILICIKYKRYLAHRLAWLYMTGVWPKHNIDHINGIRDDNRWCNLRDVTQSVNMQNQHRLLKNNTSGYAGVVWNKEKNKWGAQIMVNYKNIHLGYFDDKDEAGVYRLQKKRALHEGCTI
jgi:hypothetical protein